MNDTINTATDTDTATKHYQCRHIFTDGHRCASPCLRQEEFCYYHHTTRKPIANPRNTTSQPPLRAFHIPLPEDRSAILQSIGEVLQRIAANDIDPRRAGLLLYGLQIAKTALPKEPKEPSTTNRRTRSSRDESPATPQTVEEITLDPTHGILAPRAEITTPESRPSFARMLIQHLENCKPETNELPQHKIWEDLTPPPTNPPTEPEILPTLQATDATQISATEATVPGLRNRTIGRPYHGQRRQILIHLVPSATQLEEGCTRSELS